MREWLKSWTEASIFSLMVACKEVSPRSKQLISWSKRQRLGRESARGGTTRLSHWIQRQLRTSSSQTWISRRTHSSADLEDWTRTWLGHLLMLKLRRQNHLPYLLPLPPLVKFPPANGARHHPTMCHLLNDLLCKASQAHRGPSAQVVSKSWENKLSNDELKSLNTQL